MSIFTVENTPAEIVKIYPKASDIFRTYNINFCCGGDKPLQQTFESKHLDSEDIMAQLNHSYNMWQANGRDGVHWESMSLVDIVDYITFHYHESFQLELPKLDQFVTRVYQVHGADQPHLQKMYQQYELLKESIMAYILKREKGLFPLIKDYNTGQTETLLNDIKSKINVLKEERQVIEDILMNIRNITNSFTPPSHACGTYRVTYDRLEEMREQIFEYLDLETTLFNRI